MTAAPVLACLLAGLAFSVAPRAEAETDPRLVYGTIEKPLRHAQFETMRALAHFLDGTARNVADTGHETLSGRSRKGRDLIASLDAFSRTATEFHKRMDGYEERRWDVWAEVLALGTSASRLSDAIRRGPASGEVADEWRDAAEAVSRMRRLLSGLAVQVPPARRRLPDYDRDYRPFPEGRDQGYEQYQRKRSHGGTDDPDYHSQLKGEGVKAGGSAPLIGPRLERYRGLVGELETHARRARELADASAPDSKDSLRTLAAGIRQLGVEAARLRESAGSGPVDGGLVKQQLGALLEAARTTDRGMRQAGAFRKVWTEWAQSMDVLEQLARLVGD